MQKFHVTIEFISSEQTFEMTTCAPSKFHAEGIAGLEARKEGVSLIFKRFTTKEISDEEKQSD